MVSGGPTRLALRHSAGVERKPRPRDSTRVGTSLSFVLELLAGIDDLDACYAVVVQSVVVEHLAFRIFHAKAQSLRKVTKIIRETLTSRRGGSDDDGFRSMR